MGLDLVDNFLYNLLSGVIYTEIKLLTDEKKKELTNNILLNGGKPIDEDFKELEVYLINNPKEKVIEYLDN